VIHRWRTLKNMTDDERIAAQPRVVIFGGKAAPGYFVAKLIIKLINCVAEKINNDVDMETLLKVVFVPNYNVSTAEILIPASDISQHISTAGMEASGTSNMKFAMNGGLILGTMDGANIEIREEIGKENMFIFGLLAEDVEPKRKEVYSGEFKWPDSFQKVIDLIRTGTFGDFPEVQQLLDTISHRNDYYLVAMDWEDYIRAQNEIDETFRKKDKWTEMSILSVAGTGKFSSDRSVKDYAEKIWDLKPYPRPGPINVDPRLMSPHFQLGQGMNLHDGISPLSSRVALERLSAHDVKLVESFSPSPSRNAKMW
jgi:glycogen phosphorylase